jgi:hypothetical protein
MKKSTKCTIMAQEPWDSDDDGSYGYSEEDSEDSEEDSDDDFRVNPPPSPSPSAKLAAASTSTGVARLETTTERDPQSGEEPLCSLSDLPTMFKELPPILVLGFLDMKSRSRLQLTCKLMHDILFLLLI